MPLLVTAAFASGVLLIFLALTRPKERALPATQPVASLPVASGRDASGVARRDLLLAGAAAGGAVGAAAQALLGWPVVTLAAGAAGAVLPSWYFEQRAARRRAEVEEAVAEAVDALRDAARVGLGIEEALRLLGQSGPLPLRSAFVAIERDLRFDGLEAALLAARERIADPGFDTLVAALLTSYRIGGRNLAQVLDGLGRSVRAGARARREIQASQAQNVMSARVIAALPLVLLLAIRSTNPSYLAVFSSPAGQAVLALCLLSVVVGYAGMLRATRLPIGRRLLR